MKKSDLLVVWAVVLVVTSLARPACAANPAAGAEEETRAASSQPAAAATTQADVEGEVRLALKVWAAGDFKAREAATQRLIEIGPAVMPALQDAIRSDNPEVTARVRSVFIKLNYGLPPTASREAAEWMQRLFEADSAWSKTNAIRQMIDHAGLDGWRAGLTIARVESDRDLVAAVTGELQMRAGRFADSLLAQGRLAEAEDLLCQPEVRHSKTRFCEYATFQFLRGRADEAIRQEQAVPAEMRDFRLLAELNLAKGDLVQARAAAEKATGEYQLLAKVAALQFDWKAAAAAFAQQAGETQDSDVLGALALLHRLAGNQEQANKSIEALKNARKVTDGYGEIDSYAKCLLMAGLTDEAIELCKGKKDLWAFNLLLTQGRFQEALDLNPVDQDKQIDLLRAGLLYRVGQVDKAKAMLPDLLAAARDSKEGYDTSPLGDIAAMERRWGLKQEADKHLVEAFLAGNRKELEQVYHVSAEAMFPKRADLARVCWYALLAQNPDEPEGKLIGKLRSLLADKLSRERFIELAEQALVNWPPQFKGKPSELAYRLCIISNACRQAGYPDLAVSYLEKEGQAPGGAPAWVSMADLLVEQQRWAEAADHYDKALHAVTICDYTTTLFKQGWALVKAGRKQEGERLMERVRLQPLPSEFWRSNLAETMRSCGLEDEADFQSELGLRTNLRLTPNDGDICLNRLSWKAQKAEEFDKAADYAELECLTHCGTNGTYSDPGMYLGLRARIHRLRTCALVKAGKFDAAAAEAQAGEALWPIDTNFASELVNLLDKASARRQADALFDKCFAFHKKILKHYPASAEFLNNTAWLAVCSHRQLDEALTMAEQAVKLEPENGSNLDTLAEAHFQLGHRDQAIEFAKRSIQFEPDSEVLKRHLARFQTGDPATQPD